MLKRNYTKVTCLLLLLFSCAGAGYSQVEVGVGGRPEFNQLSGVVLPTYVRLEVYGRIRVGASDNLTQDPQLVVQALSTPDPSHDFQQNVTVPNQGDKARWAIVSNRAGVLYGITGDPTKQGQVFTWDTLKGWTLAPAPGRKPIVSPGGSITIEETPTEIRIDIAPCGHNQFLQYDTLLKKWNCVDGPGGTIPPCNDGQFLVYNADSQRWDCTDIKLDSLITCPEGQTLAWISGTWTCVPRDTLPTTCTAGQFLVFDGVNWICGPVVTSGPVQGTGSTADPVTLAPCPDGQTWVFLNGVWTCSVAGKTYTGISPIEVDNTANTIGLAPGTHPGDYYCWDSLAQIWTLCQTQQDEDWHTDGNTVDATKFIGTLNAEDFRVQTNSIQRMVVLRDGKVVVNNTISAPTDRFSSYLTAGDPEINAIHGYAVKPLGAGVMGENASTTGTGVIGLGNAITTTIFPPAWLGIQSAGVVGNGTIIGSFGYSSEINKESFGVVGITNSRRNEAAGVYGIADNVGGATFGVRGESYSEDEGAAGVYGLAAGASNTAYGVYGWISNAINNSVGVAGEATGVNGINYGVAGQTLSKFDISAGVIGNANAESGRTAGVRGTSVSNSEYARGLEGVATALTGKTQGVFGRSFSNTAGASGVMGFTQDGETYGVHGETFSKTSFSAGVYGLSDGLGAPLGSDNAYIGVYGACYKNTGRRYGVYGVAPHEANSWGVYSEGSVYVNGDAIASGYKEFRIDHPNNPTDKILSHVCPESNEALNIYSGNITTDANGEATVQLPDYFETINKDFRYNLTAVGTFAQAIVGKKVQNNRFVIKTDKPNVEVSWQVTGVRNDLHAQKHPFVAEQEKGEGERGKYLTPELYGQPKEQGIHFVPKRSHYDPAKDNTREDYKFELKRPAKTSLKRDVTPQR